MTEQWIVFNPEAGDITTHDTEAAALNDATALIEGFLGDVWSDEVEQIVVAKVTHTCERIVLHTRADMTDEQWYEITADDNDCQEWLDYKMVDHQPKGTS